MPDRSTREIAEETVQRLHDEAEWQVACEACGASMYLRDELAVPIILAVLDAERVGRERAERMYANSQDTVSEVTAAFEQAEAERNTVLAELQARVQELASVKAELDDAIEDAQIGGAHWQKIYNVLKAERDRLREALTTMKHSWESVRADACAEAGFTVDDRPPEAVQRCRQCDTNNDPVADRCAVCECPL